MGLSPAAVLYDADGHAVGLVLDGTVYRLGVAAKAQNAAGTVVNPATEDTLATRASETTAAAIKSKTDNLDVALSTRATEATLLAADGRLTTIDAVLDAIKDTAGIKKITDQLPAGTNEIGKVAQGTKGAGANAWPTVLYDVNGNAVAVDDQKRLKVNTGASFAGFVGTYLLNGTASDMNVNGSVTPVVFKYEPGADADVEMLSLSLIIEEPTIAFGTSFFGATGLTNGLWIQAKISDVVYELTNMKYTRDGVFFCGPGGFDYISATPDLARCFHEFPSGMVLKKAGTFATNDYLRITVRDNLTSLDFMKCRFEGMKIL